MKVKDMIEWLSGLDPDMNVLVLEQRLLGSCIDENGYKEGIFDTFEFPFDPGSNVTFISNYRDGREVRRDLLLGKL